METTVAPAPVCPRCLGQKTITTVATVGGKETTTVARCPACNGTGTRGPWRK